jgi:hypothetical protein
MRMGMRGGRGNISGQGIALRSTEQDESGVAVDFTEGNTGEVVRGVVDDGTTY